MARPGRQLINSVRDYLRLKRWLVWTNSAGAVKVGDRFVRFSEVGLPDIMAIRHTANGLEFLACECKAGKDRIRPAQQAWLDAIAAHGGIVIVARSVADVERILQ